MAYARWAPDSRRILTVCDFNIKLTIWSLVDRSTNYLQFPKYADKGISFTSNGYFMALGERRDTKDFIGVYYVGDWTLVSVSSISKLNKYKAFQCGYLRFPGLSLVKG